MRDVSRLKSWLTLSEAGGMCRTRLGEFLEPVDLYRLALDGHLQLFAVFPDVHSAKLFQAVDEREVVYQEVENLAGTGTIRLPVAGEVYKLADGTTFQATEKIVRLADDTPWQLAMYGGERADIQRLHWKELRVDFEETTSIDGTFLVVGKGRERKLLQLLGELPREEREGVSYYPIGNLPENTIIALTNDALDELILTLTSASGGLEESEGGTSSSAGRWPWGAHETELLRHMEAAAKRWWANVDPSDNTTAPKNEEVSAWLQARRVSARTADAIATILRSDQLPTGPRV